MLTRRFSNSSFGSSEDISEPDVVSDSPERRDSRGTRRGLVANRRMTPLPWLSDPLVPPPPSSSKAQARAALLQQQQQQQSESSTSSVVEYGDGCTTQQWRPQKSGGESARRAGTTTSQTKKASSKGGCPRAGQSGRLVIETSGAGSAILV
eukprot:TRINITY_DN6705_c0_g2_i1.p1 TRINITY_DN6705_c0_g2~~TRINITY_DN6705_c0_g2_i1.p1  ORF type:complete len:151 (+),score=31.83 TRINITY_DN6705_c0_g2_i1:250-702(+)